MKLAECAEILSELTYKPGTVLKVSYDIIIDSAKPGISCCVPDATGEKEKVQLLWCELFDPKRFWDEEDFTLWVLESILRLEAHEASEWLKRNGKHVREPHPERTCQYCEASPG